jgi:hypothetical protein
MWYPALLLVFDYVAALVVVASLRSRRIELEDSQERHRWNSRDYRALSNWGWVLVTTVSFVRLRFPVGAVLDPLSIRPAYLPQYIFAYSLGYLSVHQK